MNIFSSENLWPDYEADFGTAATVPSFAGTTEVHALPSQEGSFILSLDDAAPGSNTTTINGSSNHESYR